MSGNLQGQSWIEKKNVNLFRQKIAFFILKKRKIIYPCYIDRFLQSELLCGQAGASGEVLKQLPDLLKVCTFAFFLFFLLFFLLYFSPSFPSFSLSSLCTLSRHCYLPSFSLYLFCLSLLFFYFLLFFRLLSIFRLEDVGRMLPSAMSLVAPVKQYTLTFMRTLLAGAGPRHLSCAIATFARGCAPGAATKLLGSGRSRVGLDELAKAVYDEKYSEGALNQVMSHLFLRLPLNNCQKVQCLLRKSSH